MAVDLSFRRNGMWHSAQTRCSSSSVLNGRLGLLGPTIVSDLYLFPKTELVRADLQVASMTKISRILIFI
jgi:hypothetical protein